MNTEPDLETDTQKKETKPPAVTNTTATRAKQGPVRSETGREESPAKQRSVVKKNDGLEMVRLQNLKVEEMCCIIKTEGSEIVSFVPLLEANVGKSTILRKRVVLCGFQARQANRTIRVL